jgi:hypothetical protein
VHYPSPRDRNISRCRLVAQDFMAKKLTLGGQQHKPSRRVIVDSMIKFYHSLLAGLHTSTPDCDSEFGTDLFNIFMFIRQCIKGRQNKLRQANQTQRVQPRHSDLALLTV